jgi:ornithine carbamoyltransferase
MPKRDLLNFKELSRQEMERLFELASDLKRKQKQGTPHPFFIPLQHGDDF